MNYLFGAPDTDKHENSVRKRRARACTSCNVTLRTCAVPALPTGLQRRRTENAETANSSAQAATVWVRDCEKVLSSSEMPASLAGISTPRMLLRAIMVAAHEPQREKQCQGP